MSGIHAVGRCRAGACGRVAPLWARGYCHRCYKYWHRHGVERPAGVGPISTRVGPPGVPPAQAAGWIELAGQGWAPPAGYCTPGENYGQVAGCAGCAWRADCQALTLGRAG